MPQQVDAIRAELPQRAREALDPMFGIDRTTVLIQGAGVATIGPLSPWTIGRELTDAEQQARLAALERPAQVMDALRGFPAGAVMHLSGLNDGAVILGGSGFGGFALGAYGATSGSSSASLVGRIQSPGEIPTLIDPRISGGGPAGVARPGTDVGSV